MARYWLSSCSLTCLIGIKILHIADPAYGFLQELIKSSRQRISAGASSQVIEDSYCDKLGLHSRLPEDMNSNIGGRSFPIWRAGQGTVPAREKVDG